MINGKTVLVVLPAFNAEKTLEMTFNEIPKDILTDANNWKELRKQAKEDYKKNIESVSDIIYFLSRVG